MRRRQSVIDSVKPQASRPSSPPLRHRRISPETRLSRRNLRQARLVVSVNSPAASEPPALRCTGRMGQEDCQVVVTVKRQPGIGNVAGLQPHAQQRRLAIAGRSQDECQTFRSIQSFQQLGRATSPWPTRGRCTRSRPTRGRWSLVEMKERVRLSVIAATGAHHQETL